MNRSVLPLNPVGYLGRNIGCGGGGGNQEETKDQLAILDQGVRVIVVGRVGEVRYLKVKVMYIYIIYGIKICLALFGWHWRLAL